MINLSLLSEDVKEKAEKVLGEMEQEVTIYLFTSDDCETCDDNVELSHELAELSDKLTVEIKSLDSELAEKFDAGKYDGAPVSVITEGSIEGVKYYGIPSGEEFQSYLDDVVSVSKKTTDLDDDVKQAVKDIDQEVNLKVFVTPKCPYCPKAVRLAHKFAIENENITGEMIEAQEFREISGEYRVRGVPQVNINGKEHEFTGAHPAEDFLDQIKQAL